MSGIKENTFTIAEMSGTGLFRIVVNGNSRVIAKQSLLFEFAQIAGLQETIDTLATKTELANAILNSPEVIFTTNYSSLILLTGDTEKLYIINEAETVGSVTYAQYSQFKYNGSAFVLMTNSAQPKTVSDGKRRVGKNGSWVLEADGKTSKTIPIVDENGQFVNSNQIEDTFDAITEFDTGKDTGKYFPTTDIFIGDPINEVLVLTIDSEGYYVDEYENYTEHTAHTTKGTYRQVVTNSTVTQAWTKLSDGVDLATVQADITALEARKEVKIYPLTLSSSMQISAEEPHIVITHLLNADYYKVVLYDKDRCEFPTQGLVQKSHLSPKNMCTLLFSDLIEGTMTGYIEAII